MKKRLFFLLAAFCILVPCAQGSAQTKTFAVMPFTVDGPPDVQYLEKSLPQMLSSRLATLGAGRVQPASISQASLKKITSDAEAAEQQSRLKTAYLVWGTLTVKGPSSTLDVRVRDEKGQIWSKSTEGMVNNIIPQLQNMAVATTRDAFRLPVTEKAAPAAAPAAQARPQTGARSPEILGNTGAAPQQGVYINPQFRYAGGEDTTLLRSQSLNFPAVSMELGDVDGDGRNEIIILGEHKVYAARFENGRLNILAEHPLSLMLMPINLRLWDDRSGRPKIIVNARDERRDVATQVLSFDGAQFHVENKKVPYYLNVLASPPDYAPTLIGQEGDLRDPFRPGIYEMIKTADGFSPGKKLKMPQFANVFAIDWLPDAEDGDKFLMLTDQERLRVYTETLKELAETDEKYSGSSVGIELTDNPFGNTSNDDGVRTYYHVPIRMIVNDLDGNGKNEVIVLKPVSTASQIFANYRTFPQGEIQSLFWDGLGMNLQWKTRRIKGTVVDFNFADINNDGKPYLVVLVNSHPGALGLQNRRAMVLAYPLDLTLTDPNTPTSVTE